MIVFRSLVLATVLAVMFACVPAFACDPVCVAPQVLQNGKCVTPTPTPTPTNNNINTLTNNNTETYNAAKIPVNTAYAPTSIPTSPCLKGYSGGAQAKDFGFSLGGDKVDAGCDARETARTYMLMDARKAACKVMVYSKKNQKLAARHPEQAVTMEDCMYKEVEVIPPALPIPPAPVPQPTVIVVPAPAPVPVVAPAPVPAVPVPQVAQLIGICTFGSSTSCLTSDKKVVTDPARPTFVCKEMLTATVEAFHRNSGSTILLKGNRNSSEDLLLASSRANRVKQQLEEYGVPSSSISTEVGTGDTRTVEIVLVPASK